MADKEVAWQQILLQLERNRYMLENTVGSDVCFEICPSDGSSSTVIRAHKLSLVSASPVFKAMFHGGMAEAQAGCGNIKIPDVDAETFIEMLRFIYGEKASITVANAGPLMYAAKKYLLVELVAECVKTLEKFISNETVCAVLQHSVFLSENELKNKCLEFISVNTHDVLSTEGFMHLSRDSLLEVVSLKTVVLTTERKLFACCLAWARFQLQESGLEDPSDDQLRDQLGDVLFRIRFPTMSQEEFARLTAQSKVLTSDEKHDVYVYMALKVKLPSLKFGTDCRGGMDVVNRFQFTRSLPWRCDGLTDAVCLETTADSLLMGVGLYGGLKAATHDVKVEVLIGDQLLCTTVTKMISDGSPVPVKILFEKPAVIRASIRYTVAVTIKGSKTWAGENGSTVEDLGASCKMAFSDSNLSRNASKAHIGQIPQLFYRLMH